MKTPAIVVVLAISIAPLAANAQKPRPEDTEIYKPVPVVVTPGKTDLDAPSDAVILFDGHDESQWVTVKDHAPADWDVHDGLLTVNKHAGNIETKRSFTNYQLHIEWNIPVGISGTGQARGNSGVFLSSTGPGDDGYEIQVLDSYNNATYVNGQAAAIYKQYPPLVNAMRPPGQWNVYDVVWTAPTFKSDGSLDTPAYVTAFHNGVLVQNHVALLGPTLYIGKPSYKAHGPEPIKLQAHGDPSAPISFRNIWARPLPDVAQVHVP
jgi:hypothetical protein